MVWEWINQLPPEQVLNLIPKCLFGVGFTVVFFVALVWLVSKLLGDGISGCINDR